MMLNRLRALLGSTASSGAAPSETLSTAVLLLELARSDFDLADAERQCLRELLASRYSLDAAALDALLAEAQARAAAAVSLHDDVQSLNTYLDAEGKCRLMAMLWQVAYADGRIDKYEEHLLRRLADLLYVPMADYVRIKIESGQTQVS